MKILPTGHPRPFEPRNFTGPGEVERLYQPADEHSFGMATVVHHREGSMSKPHSHSGGQYLYFLDGDGLVGEESQDGVVEARISSGTLVVSEPGVIHWHGAVAGKDVTVFSVTWGGVDWNYGDGGR